MEAGSGALREPDLPIWISRFRQPTSLRRAAQPLPESNRPGRLQHEVQKTQRTCGKRQHVRLSLYSFRKFSRAFPQMQVARRNLMRFYRAPVRCGADAPPRLPPTRDVARKTIRRNGIREDMRRSADNEDKRHGPRRVDFCQRTVAKEVGHARPRKRREHSDLCSARRPVPPPGRSLRETQPQKRNADRVPSMPSATRPARPVFRSGPTV